MPTCHQTSVVLFFVDGLGIGERSESNPLFGLDAEPLAHFVGANRDYPELRIVPTDPRLGVDGRPQSASGQTTILTGVNAPKLLGYHKNGFPNQTLREVIAKESIFRKLITSGIEEVVFANAYTPQFFAETPRWKSATTVAMESAGIAFRKLPDLVGRAALFHDFTNRTLRDRGFEVPLFTPTDAAGILGSLSTQYRFVLYEHFLTDKIGHDQDRQAARRHLPELAEFVRETIVRLDPERTTFILTSDHGNIEDLSVRNHTLNDVPTIVWGRRRDQTASRINDLADIAPAIFDLLAHD